MLNQQTAANTANQAAMMAGQRGAGANAGLLARQAAMQGAANQQNAIGQGAMMNAQQQIAARGQLMQQQAGMGSLAGQQVGQQAAGLGGLNSASQGLFGTALQGLNTGQANAISQQNALNNAAVGMQSNINNANVGMQSNINNANLGMQSNINNANQANTANMNNTNAGIAQGNQAAQSGLLSGALKGLSSAATNGAAMADGGEVLQQQPMPAIELQPMQQAPTQISPVAAQIKSGWEGALSKNQGGEIPEHHALAYLKAHKMGSQAPLMNHQAYAQGGDVGQALKSGGAVPGEAQVQGDSLKNDTVKALLSPGEVVIPRSIMESKDPAKAAAAFIASILKKKSLGKH